MSVLSRASRRHWRASVLLAALTLGLWALLVLVLPFAAAALDRATFAGLPLGRWMLAQGALAGLLLLVAAHNRRQDRLDDRVGLDDE